MGLSALITKVIDVFYMKPLRGFIPQQVFRYLACGAANAALDAVWYFVIYHYIVCERFIDLGCVVVSPHIASLIIVFPITFFTGFWLNRNVAFRTIDVRTLPQILRYGLSVLGSIALNYLCMKFFVEVCHIWPTISKMTTTMIVALYSFLAARYFSFRK